MQKKVLGYELLKDWGFGKSHPFIIAGPCGVESEEQIHAVAKSLNNSVVHLFRAGIWKPRTRPDSFQGIGTVGLQWLKDAGNENNLPVAVEVAGSKHVEEALKTGIDVLWIGARTTVNPFLVQEIADSLRNVDIPVFVKNPVSPDLELWIGALERLDRAGLHRIGALHRGFSTYDSSPYRNIPNWQIPIELKRRFPGLPLLSDPSHICGNRKLIPSVSQTALDLDFDGLMIEVHHDPDNALSDKEQQLNPELFMEILSGLVIRKPSAEDVIFLNLLEELRDRIDRIDEKILMMIADRMKVAREIGMYKKENNMTILQVERWNEILRTRLRSGLRKDLTREFVTKMYELIHEESILHQTNVMNTGNMYETKSSKDS
ncbi:MAG: 3-deoxy-7-phosphoheptulonate synthase [Bacteroidetes bacterium]|nr:MAG: 3-deoxy-7-phosphoheptulonate synthase [Bacteroidota bacterium]REK08013.1 MAG: 3-deoxy-7-phosphoheptulonate synthase [Bacteroidota bacterium]REK32218.1 MAG: 3-deoxy-7-phosphoheptulonate synthase [Bacteroidota bacterium]REK47370.1 MAG: 3-deoxy-7-phosphoheptulonate synthase [Bacteroidota bacterium]